MPAAADGGAGIGSAAGVHLCPLLPGRGGDPGLRAGDSDPAGLCAHGGGRGEPGADGRGHAPPHRPDPKCGHRHQSPLCRESAGAGGGGRRPPAGAAGVDRAVPRLSGAVHVRGDYLSAAAAEDRRLQRRVHRALGPQGVGQVHLRPLRQDSAGGGGPQHRDQDAAHGQGL